jgi:CDP-paratose 2-epimerase
LLELLSYLDKRSGKHVDYAIAPARPGDQLVYISDTSRAERELNWKPRVSCDSGLDSLYDWVHANKHEFETGHAAEANNVVSA